VVYLGQLEPPNLSLPTEADGMGGQVIPARHFQDLTARYLQVSRNFIGCYKWFGLYCIQNVRAGTLCSCFLWFTIHSFFFSESRSADRVFVSCWGH
jgi:hypothetical protein